MQGLVRRELLTAADTLAREKGLSRERVLKAIEEGLVQIAQDKYGEDAVLSATINRTSGEICFFQTVKVVENPQNSVLEVTLEEAQQTKPEAVLGESLQLPLPAVSFGRVPSSLMRQSILRLVKEVVREKEYAEYKDRVGELITGTVKSIDYGQIILDIGRGEGVLMPRDTIPRERFRPDDRVRAYIREVTPDPKGFQIFLSRTHPQFMVELFKQEVPEVYSGVIQIKAVARDPGSRAKIGVMSSDPSLDPVGGCVGLRGSRVQAVTNELRGERIDVVRWSDDLYTVLVNALTPATPTKIIEDDEENAVQVVVPDEQLSIAVGRGGQNVQLASKLCNLHIRVISATQESEQRTEHLNKISQLFAETLKLDDVTSRFLASEGFESLADIALSDPAELLSLEGFTEDRVATLQQQASLALEEQKQQILAEIEKAGGDKTLIELDTALTPEILKRLVSQNIKNKTDLAGLSSDELLDHAPNLLSTQDAERVILKARDLPMPAISQESSTPSEMQQTPE